MLSIELSSIWLDIKNIKIIIINFYLGIFGVTFSRSGYELVLDGSSFLYKGLSNFSEFIGLSEFLLVLYGLKEDSLFLLIWKNDLKFLLH